MTILVLVLNAGSSSLKYQVVDPASGPARGPRPRGAHRRGRSARPRRGAGRDARRPRAHRGGCGVAGAVGHRVVHGGPTLVAPTVVDDAVLGEIDDLARLAPLHNPPAAAGIRSARRPLPGPAPGRRLRHRVLRRPAGRAATYAMPSDLAAHRMRRYGAHGISHECVASAGRRVPRPAAGRARPDRAAPRQRRLRVRDQRRPAGRHLDGPHAPGGSRHGHPRRRPRPGRPAAPAAPRRPRPRRARGPAAPPLRPARAHRQHRRARRPDAAVGRRGRQRAGGVRRLRPPNPEVRRRLPRRAGGADVITFTAGVGEHSPRVRATRCAGLEELGIELDEERNEGRGRPRRISTASSPVAVLVVPTNEELAIAGRSSRRSSADAAQKSALVVAAAVTDGEFPRSGCRPPESRPSPAPRAGRRRGRGSTAGRDVGCRPSPGAARRRASRGTACGR